jgi:predicted dehydrogenase
MTWGVGIVGAGMVTRAIHVPTLARMPESFRVKRIVDVDGDTAAVVAGAIGAVSGTEYSEILDDPEIEVVVVGSPDRFHADQAIAACRAGKRALLIEKPFAENVEQATEVAAVAREHGVVVVIGAMHVFDPGWRFARERWRAGGDRVHTLRVQFSLLDGLTNIGGATEFALPEPSDTPPPAPPASPPTLDAEVRQMRAITMGLFVHELPLIRELTGTLDELDLAVSGPGGVVLAWRSTTGARVQITTPPHDGMPIWSLDAWSEARSLHLDFPPSYVHAGPTRVRLADAGGAVESVTSADDGYLAEWRALASALDGDPSAVPAIESVLDDLAFTVELADAAADLVRKVG